MSITNVMLHKDTYHYFSDTYHKDTYIHVLIDGGNN